MLEWGKRGSFILLEEDKGRWHWGRVLKEVWENHGSLWRKSGPWGGESYYKDAEARAGLEYSGHSKKPLWWVQSEQGSEEKVKFEKRIV